MIEFIHESHALNMDVDIIRLAAQELGYDSVTPEQRLVIESFVKGQDVFVNLPTGSGKSLCYCLCQQFLTREGGGVDESW